MRAMDTPDLILGLAEHALQNVSRVLEWQARSMTAAGVGLRGSTKPRSAYPCAAQSPCAAFVDRHTASAPLDCREMHKRKSLSSSTSVQSRYLRDRQSRLSAGRRDVEHHRCLGLLQLHLLTRTTNARRLRRSVEISSQTLEHDIARYCFSMHFQGGRHTTFLDHAGMRAECPQLHCL